MIKITDNTNKKVYFGDLKKGDFFLSLGDLYIITDDMHIGYNCVRICDGSMCFKGNLASVIPVDIEIIITDKGEIKNEQTEQ